MSDISENKLCPFCKGLCDPEEVMWSRGSDPKTYTSPGCRKCGASVKTLEEWNTRPHEEELEAEVVRLRQALELIARNPLGGIR